MNVGEIHRACPYFPTPGRCVLLCNFTPGVELCDYHHNRDTELPPPPRGSLPPLFMAAPTPTPTDLLPISTTVIFQKCYRNEIVQHVTF